MKPHTLLVILGIVAVIIMSQYGVASADSIRGKNYDLERNGQHYVWTSSPDRMNIGGQWTNYRATDNPSWYKFESANGSITIDKTTCSIKLMDPGLIAANETPLIDSVSQVVKEAANGTDAWKSHAVNDQSCEFAAVNSERGVKITLTRQNMALGLGTKFDTVYDIDYSGNIKSTFRYTNNDILKINSKYGFSQVFDGVFTVNVGGKEYSTGGNDSITIPREDLQDRIISITKNGFTISYDPQNYIHNYLWAVKIKHNQIVFDFMFSKGALPVGQVLEIDPTFGYAFASSDKAVQSSNGMGASCDNPGYTVLVYPNIYKAVSSVSNSCSVKAFQWDTSTIPDTAIIATVNLQYDISVATNAINCDFNEVTSDITTETGANLWSQINTGTTWVDNDAGCTTVGNDKIVTLGAAAANALQGLLSQDRFAVGVTEDDKTRDATSHTMQFTDGQEELQVIYSLGQVGYEIKPEVYRP